MNPSTHVLNVLPLRIFILMHLSHPVTTRINKRIEMIFTLCLLNDLEAYVKSFPLPVTWFQKWAIRQIFEWIDKEREAINILVDAGVQQVGYLKK